MIFEKIRTNTTNTTVFLSIFMGIKIIVFDFFSHSAVTHKSRINMDVLYHCLIG